MTAETRRNILRYGIAVDLVILATGVGLLVPDLPAVLFIAFTMAVVLASWKGRWQGGLTALLLSVLAAWYFFLPAFPASRMAAFVAVSTALGALVVAARARKGTVTAAPAVVDELADVAPNVVAFEMPPAPVPDEAEAPAQQTADTPMGQKRRRAERKRRQAEEQRAARERDAAERAERLTREREERLAREAREREEAERVAREAREREEAERVAREAREREEADRVAREAREREEAERVAREAREREEAERVAREAREREEAERVAREAREREEAAREAREREEAERVAREAREREEAERVAREAWKREEAERVAREAQEREDAERGAREAREREEAARGAREAREREEAARLAREAREREEAEREALEREKAERIARERDEAFRAANEEAERLTREREEAARLAREARERAEAERRAAEEELRRAEAGRREAEALAAKEREEAERVTREARERLEAEKRAAEERLAVEREALRAEHERKLAAEREALDRDATERTRTAPVLERPPEKQHRPTEKQPEKPSLVDTLTGWFRRAPSGRNVNLNTRKIANNRRPTPAPNTVRRPAAPVRKERNPRLLLLERRRGTADTVAPKLKQRGIDVAVVERWVDSVDELFRFRPDAMLLDTEHPEFDLAYKTITDQNPKLPIILTGRSAAGFQQLPNVRYATFAVRPYDPDELSRLAQTAMLSPDKLLQQQATLRTPARPASGSTPAATATTAVPATASAAEARPVGLPKPAAPLVVAVKPATDNEYEVVCISCRTSFDALDADWCSCLTKERTLVCTNCLTCFCKAVPAYKERFWVEAPPRLFERKTAEARRQQSGLPANPEPEVAKRPLVLCVEDDEEIQAIVQRVCSNLGYGFIYATNGQDGLNIARLYRPNLILSDAFMPKLDGREMCRLLKEEPIGADIRMIIMTGLYTDTKYRSEAVKRFHVDDYVAKPVAITDLINLLQKHLEGVAGLPVQDDMFERHRRDVEEHLDRDEDGEEDGIALADLLTAEIEDDHDLEPMAAQPAEKPRPQPRTDAYAVACVNCREMFDATKAEWCSCVGRDQTLACTLCNGCFCKAPASYKERFWMDAPPSLFERKMIGSKRNLGARSNPTANEVKRPLILLVEDDENVQLIVRTVVTSMGYGFIAGANGQEGLSLAREYDPDLILSDAFMPKLDGREMCRLLKEDPATARSKAIIMTGLYTDRKYRNEALDYFKVDDYVAKPLAVDDLIKLFKKHLPQEVQAAS